MRCPRCKIEIDARPEGGAPGGPIPAARGPSFCPSCGAPLRLAEEPTPGPLDVPISLDRREAPMDLDEGMSGLTPPPPSPRREPTTRRSELADVERSHWELGKALDAAARSIAQPGSEASRGTGPETWPGRASPPPAPVGPVRREPAGSTTGPTSRPAPPSAAPGPPPLPPPASPRRAPALRTGEERGTLGAETGPPEIRLRRPEGWRRATAWAVDGVPFAVAGVMILRWALRETAVRSASQGPEGPLDLVAREPAIVLSVLAAVALALAVYGTLAHFLAGATLGKRLLGLRLVGADGGRPSLGRSSLRSALAIVSAGLLGLGFLLALFTRSGRSLHDLLARTWVVRAP